MKFEINEIESLFSIITLLEFVAHTMRFRRPLPSLPAHLKVKVDSLTPHQQTKQELGRPCPIIQREGDFLSIRPIYREQAHCSECVLMRSGVGEGQEGKGQEGGKKLLSQE
jgi:hypothetical protein